MRRVCILAVVVSLPLAAVACSGSEKPTYLALGDSYAAGVGASDKDEGYVPLFFSFLGEARGEHLSLRNLAISGETTSSMIATGQFGMALAELRFRNQDQNTKNDVFVVTIDIGYNDILRFAGSGQPCAPPTPAGAPTCAAAVDDALDATTQNLTSMLRSLRIAAGPSVKILILDYFNSYSGTGRPLEDVADFILPPLNRRIAEVAALPGIEADVVHTFAAFDGKGGQLTNINGPGGDFHPNDDGYRVLADLLIDAYKR